MSNRLITVVYIAKFHVKFLLRHFWLMPRTKRASSQGPSILRNRELPMWWLSAPKISKPIKSKNIPNLTLYTTKAPIESTSAFLQGSDYKWTIADVKNYIDAPDANIYAVNASLNYPTNEEEWENNGFKCGRIQVNKEYDPAAVDEFEKLVDDFVAESGGKNVVVVVFSSLGINRPGFLISAFISRKDLNPIDDNLKELSKLMSCPVYANKANVSLSTTFNVTIDPVTCPFITEEPKPTTPAETAATIERVVNWRRFTRKEINDSERTKVLNKLREALPENWPYDGDFPQWPTKEWSNDYLNQIKASKYYTSFVPRGKLSFLVILGHKSVYTVSMDHKVYLLLASFKESHHQSFPIVCAVTWVEEKLRVSAILTDLMMFDNKKYYDSPIQERHDILYDDVVKRLKSEVAKQDAVTLQFIYRPLCELRNIKRLVEDLNKFACNPESIVIIPADGNPGNDITISISPTITLFFEYNGGQKAALVAYNEGKGFPVLVYTFEDKKEINFHNYLVRMYCKDQRWSIISIFAKAKSTDDASTTDEVNKYVETVSSLPDIESISNELSNA